MCFAYRKNLSPQAVAMVGRSLLALWCAKYAFVVSLDWDEKNAFCNVARAKQDKVTGHPALEVERWASHTYDSMQLCVVSPFGLVGPYKLRHGGPQGSNMGVGLFNNMGLVRTWFNDALWRNNLQPKSLRPGPYDSQALSPALPWKPDYLLPEICYSDDGRGFALSESALSYLLLTESHSCWAVGGSMIFSSCKYSRSAFAMVSCAIQREKSTLCSVSLNTADQDSV